VAVDAATRQVGVTAASCWGSDISFVYRLIPGQGALAAQAYFSERARDEASELLKQGMPPERIIAAITAPTFDADAAKRQYGIATLNGLVSTFTGQRNDSVALGRTGSTGNYTYSIQGNFLTGPVVVDQANAGFESGACDLAERLMNALGRGAAGKQGDRRCTVAGIPANAAFIAVDNPTGASGDYLRLSVSARGAEDAVAKLRDAFTTWRRAHPCPAASRFSPTTPAQWLSWKLFFVLLGGVAAAILSGFLVRRGRMRSSGSG
jgi:uncharacterized Ntn-hydrolase superfamily protein